MPSDNLEDWQFRIAKLELAPGDVLIVKAPARYSDKEHLMQSADVIGQLVPPGVKVLTLPHDVDLSILTKAEIDERAT